MSALLSHSPNAARAESAKLAVMNFHQEPGPLTSSALRDLLANLMHFCDWFGFDFDAELQMAEAFYLFEIEAPETVGGTR
jgi:hypothetical protein